ncbi:MAG: ABC transporter ATP-binding protein [Anaerolineales bacterium]|nr:MAG: ABC transporter ATP-binding protein [Anaerolineales bacterium]
MARVDYRAARGSNVGDDFHELWTLRQALALLDQDSNLIQLTVEGLTIENENGATSDTWDGVDCALYYGDRQTGLIKRIVIAQLKYSAADAEKTWTVARLAHSPNKKRDNSVIARLSKAFSGLKEKYPELAESGNIVVQLVSNQDVSTGVINVLSDNLDPSVIDTPKYKTDLATLQSASGLSDSDFKLFKSVFDLSSCGSQSRFALEENIIRTISNWIDDDARSALNDLMMSIRRKMLPEAKGEIVNRYSILAGFGFFDPAALFPCPSSIKEVKHLVSREISKEIAEKMVSGNQRICLFGDGGSGKTTILQEISNLLPPSSVVIVFDCYGSGRYLDADAYRHLPKDAFLQLSNDLAARLHTPLLVTRRHDHDYARVFKKRLEKAAEVVAAQDRNALLVISVDAADNSITAANTHVPPESSFVHDFVRIGDLPSNVRFLVSCRTGRLHELDLPNGFTEIQIPGFSRDETATHTRWIWNEASDTWIDDFHSLSGGNPRVQQYAMELAGNDPTSALDYLRPNGKVLDQIFRDSFQLALRKEGQHQNLKVLCAGLTALPRPIPLGDLAAVTDLSKAHVRDVCNDLAPGVRVVNELVSFSDEDFEQFVRIEGNDLLSTINVRIADYFSKRHHFDAYAATHVASAQFSAGRGSDIIELINSNLLPKAISDPVLKREVQRQRLRTAMRVCRETGNNVDAMFTLLIGADALKTDTAVRKMIVDNPDLSAFFAQDAVREILRESSEIENHGHLLFHMMVKDAKNGDVISVREGRRLLEAWLQARREHGRMEKEQHSNSQPNLWPIFDRDIQAEAEAVLRIQGAKNSLATVLRWNPKSMLLRVASNLSFKLITSGESHLVESYITDAKVGTPWGIFLLVPLALAGQEIDLAWLEMSLSKLLRRGLIRLDYSRDNIWRDDRPIIQYLDTILTACETIVARSGNRSSVIPVLERIADYKGRRRNPLVSSEVAAIELSFRAHALLERLSGRQTTLETYQVDFEPSPEDHRFKNIEEAKSWHDKIEEEISNLLKPIVSLYDTRAQILLGLIPPSDIEINLETAINHYGSDQYRFNRRPYEALVMRTACALSIARLMILPLADREVLLRYSLKLLGTNNSTSAETKILANFALDRSLHPQILQIAAMRTTSLKSLKTSAEDKISSIIDFVRLLVPISLPDAQILFNTALEVAADVNVDSVHEIALLAPLTQRAVTSMSTNDRRTSASILATVIADTAVRLSDNDHFPWERAMQALTTLDISTALAAAGQWEDVDIAWRERILPPLLETAVLQHQMSPMQASAFSSLLNEFSTDLINTIVAAASSTISNSESILLSEYLAHEELMRFGQSTRPELLTKLRELLGNEQAGFWMGKLWQTTTFHETPKSISGLSSTQADTIDTVTKEVHTKWQEFLDSMELPSSRFVTPQEIIAVILQVNTSASNANEYVPIEKILDRIGSKVALGDRALHLDALRKTTAPIVPAYEIPLAILRRVVDWSGSPSVEAWSKDHILQIAIDFLPELSRWLPYGESQLPKFLEKSNASEVKICESLLEALERYVNTLTAPAIYALIGVLASYYHPSEAAEILTRYSQSLFDRIPIGERNSLDINDIPQDTPGGIARYIYALMGDIDVRLRWRAAHTLRNLVQLGDSATLNSIIELYDQKRDISYRNPNAPFYWLSARLWLLLVLERLASENPAKLVNYGIWLLGIASDEKFPHVVIRSIAKSAASKLLASGNFSLDKSQMLLLKKSNSGRLPRRKAKWKSYEFVFQPYKYEDSKNRRFHFDSMDTLPYWYSSAIRAFADIDSESFLDAAEQRIVDDWGVQNNPWAWEDEPRKYRISDRDYLLTSHRHGSYPTIERFHTYLELHAMWTTIGELMQNHPLAKSTDEEDDSLEYILRKTLLTSPPVWLSDLRNPNPPESRFWIAPLSEVNTWLETPISDEEVLAEIGIGTLDNLVVIESQHDTFSHYFTNSLELRTALVSPETSEALMRALQTAEAWSYNFPKSGNDFEINQPPYRLLGWLDYGKSESRIDDDDPLRYGVKSIQVLPSKMLAKILNLQFIHENSIRWIDSKHGTTALIYEAWGDTRGDEPENRLIYSSSPRSDGWRLQITKESLDEVLNTTQMDLIVEIQITRKNYSYGQSRYEKDKEKTVKSKKIVLIKKDGTIESAEGHLGAWKTSRP